MLKPGGEQAINSVLTTPVQLPVWYRAAASLSIRCQTADREQMLAPAIHRLSVSDRRGKLMMLWDWLLVP